LPHQLLQNVESTRASGWLIWPRCFAMAALEIKVAAKAVGVRFLHADENDRKSAIVPFFNAQDLMALADKDGAPSHAFRYKDCPYDANHRLLPPRETAFVTTKLAARFLGRNPDQREAEILKIFKQDRDVKEFDERGFLVNYTTTHRSSAAPLATDLLRTLRALAEAKGKSTARPCFNCRKVFNCPEDHPVCPMAADRLEKAKAAAASYQPRQKADRKRNTGGSERKGRADDLSEEDSDDDSSGSDDRWGRVDADWRQPRGSRQQAAAEAPKREGAARVRNQVGVPEGMVDSSLFEFSDEEEEEEEEYEKHDRDPADVGSQDTTLVQ